MMASLLKADLLHFHTNRPSLLGGPEIFVATFFHLVYIGITEKRRRFSYEQVCKL